jgi:peptide deformylase
MAIRNIRKEGDEILRKNSKKVEIIDKKILQILNDMADTMYDANGVGLAAVQIGLLKRLVVIDVGDGLLELINPEIIKQVGEHVDAEGCLSVPGIYGDVQRPTEVVVKAQNPKGETIEIKGTELLAVALCHEIDHLNGILFKDKVLRFLDKSEMEERRHE